MPATPIIRVTVVSATFAASSFAEISEVSCALTVVPWCGADSVTRWWTFVSKSIWLMRYRASRPPWEWATMSTFSAPVAESTWSMYAPTSLADWRISPVPWRP